MRWAHGTFGQARAALVLTLFAVVVPPLLSSAQVSEEDEQFQAYHQDIGRISGSNGVRVAARTTMVEKPQPELQATLAVASAEQQPRAPTRHLTPTGSRRPSRISLVASPLASASGALAPLVAAAAPQPLEASLAPAPAQPTIFTGPALASFRSSAAPAAPSTGQASVLARHSALMAEVAAERAASGGQQQQSSRLAAATEPLSSPPITLDGKFQASFSSHAPQAAAAQPRPQAQPAIENPRFISALQADEPVVAPSFEQVLSTGCPQKGVFSWENKDHCDRYYMCTNGTFTEEACPNGLAHSQMGAVYQHCAYNWNVDCGRKKSAEPIASPGCPWQFGIFPIVQNGRCSIDYYVCEWGVPEPKRCSPEGLLYDDRIKGCQWADQLGCKSEALLNFKCPAEDEDNPYWPYPRYYYNTKDVIVCVNEQPRLVHCTEEQLVDPSSLACIDVKKKKKQF